MLMARNQFLPYMVNPPLSPDQLPRSRAARYVVTARHQTESDARGVFLYTFDLGF